MWRKCFSPTAVAGRSFTLFLLGVVMIAQAASAADLKVLSALVMKGSLNELAAGMEAAIGEKIEIEFALAGAIKKRLDAGEIVDVTILPLLMVTVLVKEGRLNALDTARTARSTIAAAVRAGAMRPDISGVDAFERSLRAAKSITYADPSKGGVSGIHFAHILERLGLADEMKAKTRLAQGPEVAELVANGEAEIGFTMTSEILPVPGVELVGQLPAELQNSTDFVYAAGIPVGANQAVAGRTLIEYLHSPAAVAVIKKNGLEPER